MNETTSSDRKNLLMLIMVLITFSLLIGHDVFSQDQTTKYIFDDSNRLVAVINPDGTAVVYTYDAVGNRISVMPVGAGDVAIAAVNPSRGSVDTVVRIQGIGFSEMLADNAVTFTGETRPVPAMVSEATFTSLTVTVPEGARTGPITVTNARGLASSPQPFMVLGRIFVQPSPALMVLGKAFRFTALVRDIPEDQSVVWSVNGALGGNERVGMVSQEGVYRAPKVDPGTALTLEARSVVQEEVSGQAMISLTDTPTDFAETAVSVQVGSPRGVAEASPVTVQVGNPVGPFINSLPVSVQVGNPLGPFVVGPPVAVASGPVLSSITPASAPPDSTDLTLTLTGQNLAGATAVDFFLLNGRADSNITVTNLDVNADGTQLMVTIDITPSAEEGTRLVIVRTADGRSQLSLSESNAFLVTQE